MKVKAKSFTLIEMVIVVGVLGFALPVFFSIIFLIIRQQSHIYALQELKKQGDNAFFSMKSAIQQNAASVVNPSTAPLAYPTIVDNCPVLPASTPTPAPYMFFYDKYGTIFSFYVDVGDTKISSRSGLGDLGKRELTNDKVKVERNDLNFSCYRTNQFSPPIILSTFKITQGGSVASPSAMQYSTKFQLRSY